MNHPVWNNAIHSVELGLIFGYSFGINSQFKITKAKMSTIELVGPNHNINFIMLLVLNFRGFWINLLSTLSQGIVPHIMS